VGRVGWIARVNGKGRISIPRDLREKLGLEKGALVVLDVNDGMLVVSKLNPQQSKSKAQEEDKLRTFLSSSY